MKFKRKGIENFSINKSVYCGSLRTKIRIINMSIVFKEAVVVAVLQALRTKYLKNSFGCEELQILRTSFVSC